MSKRSRPLDKDDERLRKKVKSDDNFFLPEEIIVEILKYLPISHIWTKEIYKVSIQFLRAFITLENILNRKQIRRDGNKTRFYHILSMKQTPMELKDEGYCHICIVEENYLKGKFSCKKCTWKNLFCRCHFNICKRCNKGFCKKENKYMYHKCCVCKNEYCKRCQHRCPLCRKWVCNIYCSTFVDVHKKKLCNTCDEKLRKFYKERK